MDTHKTAISIGSTKEAALLFDEVVPVMIALEMLDPGRPGEIEMDPEFAEFGHHIMPMDRFKTATFFERLQELNVSTSLGLFALLRLRLGGDESEIISAHADLTAARDAFAAFIEEFGFRDVPIIAPSASVQDDVAGDIALVLRNLKVIDVKGTSWRQIAEFRQDVVARQKLRRLRLFAYDNYKEKSKAFIEDDLQSRLYDYDELVRRWGFETKQAVLTSVLQSKGLAGALGGAFMAALFGAPSVAAVSAAGGTVLEIGRITLEVTKRKFLLSNALHDNPVSYVAELRERFSPQQTLERRS